MAGSVTPSRKERPKFLGGFIIITRFSISFSAYHADPALPSGRPEVRISEVMPGNLCAFHRAIKHRTVLDPGRFLWNVIKLPACGMRVAIFHHPEERVAITHH